MSFTPPYEGWRPYCLVCNTMMRMETRPYGFQCVSCKNKIKHDLTHYSGGSAWNTANHDKSVCVQCNEPIEVGESIYINGGEASCEGCGDPMDPGTEKRE